MLTLDHATVGVLYRHQWRQQKEAEGHGRRDVRGFVFTVVRPIGAAAFVPVVPETERGEHLAISAVA